MKRQRILIVEDDLQLARALHDVLGKAYDASVVHTGRDALFGAETQAFDLILLDLNLPDMDGLEVAEQLCGNGADILMLTARSDVKSRVTGIYAGAADYLSKPFEMQELLARVYAQLRKRLGPDEVHCGPLSLAVSARSCKVADQPLDLSAQEFRLLALLVANQGRVYSKYTLEERLHHEAPPNSNTVEVLVSKLRAKLARAGVYDLIQTIRGLGYVVRPRLP